MKANYIATKADYKKMAYEIAKEEVENQKQTVCPACEESMGNQIMAMILKVLHDEYGFGKKRMLDVLQKTETLFNLCKSDRKKYSALQAVEWLRDSIGIDLEKECG